jgi:hypothetical protein
LVHLANLSGGTDNVSAIVVRIGPWADPRQADTESESPPASKRPRNGGGGFRLSNLLPTFTRRSAQAEVEEHVYQSAECPLDDTLVERLSETVRKAKAIAIEQGWGVDWSVLANLQRESEEARAEGDLRGAARCLCEGVVSLGLAGRLFRKEQAHNGPS